VTGDRRVMFAAHGLVEIRYEVEIERSESVGVLAGLRQNAVRELPADALPYLNASPYCPANRFQGFVAREFGTLRGGDAAAAILAWIARAVDYRIGVSDSQTTALDTFVDRAGVCRDFTHLALTLLRAAGIPARAVSAYACDLDPPDMHAVAELYLEDSWRLIDPTGKAPLSGLVRVATGRDAADIAFMSIFGQGRLIRQSFSAERSQALAA
jgi:transglutaminase-like putative cysteine protease